MVTVGWLKTKHEVVSGEFPELISFQTYKSAYHSGCLLLFFLFGVGFLEDFLLVTHCGKAVAPLKLSLRLFFAMLRLDARRGPGPKKQKLSLFPGLLLPCFLGVHIWNTNLTR